MRKSRSSAAGGQARANKRRQLRRHMCHNHRNRGFCNIWHNRSLNIASPRPLHPLDIIMYIMSSRAHDAGTSTSDNSPSPSSLQRRQEERMFSSLTTLPCTEPVCNRVCFPLAALPDNHSQVRAMPAYAACHRHTARSAAASVRPLRSPISALRISCTRVGNFAHSWDISRVERRETFVPDTTEPPVPTIMAQTPAGQRDQTYAVAVWSRILARTDDGLPQYRGNAHEDHRPQMRGHRRRTRWCAS